ncbi:hypothetical protein EV363DRAFT_1307185, partial [Boletus edulis]
MRLTNDACQHKLKTSTTRTHGKCARTFPGTEMCNLAITNHEILDLFLGQIRLVLSSLCCPFAQTCVFILGLSHSRAPFASFTFPSHHALFSQSFQPLPATPTRPPALQSFDPERESLFLAVPLPLVSCSATMIIPLTVCKLIDIFPDTVVYFALSCLMGSCSCSILEPCAPIRPGPV